MQSIKEILKILDSISPFETQETWDNCGLNVGSFDWIPKQTFLALEADKETIATLPPNSLLIVHHPLIFKPLKNMHFECYPANLLKDLIQKEIALIALHTNFDKSHFSRWLVERILGFQNVHSDSYIAFFEMNLSHTDCVERIKKSLGLESVLCANPKDFYGKAALISGAGASLISELDVDCLLSGDLRYHDAMIARSLGRSVFDIRHYESERFFAAFMQEILAEQGIQAIPLEIKNPFIFC